MREAQASGGIDAVVLLSVLQLRWCIGGRCVVRLAALGASAAAATGMGLLLSISYYRSPRAAEQSSPSSRVLELDLIDGSEDLTLIGASILVSLIRQPHLHVSQK